MWNTYMTVLSVNINKVATLRNARGGDVPDVIRFAKHCEEHGADGITIHPRADERHIKKVDVYALKKVLVKELNIEGFPSDSFVSLVRDVRPAQVTLVPDSPTQLTSDHGWDIRTHFDFLKSLIDSFHSLSLRVSLFINPDCSAVEQAKEVGADRIELYTGPYAHLYEQDKTQAFAMYEEPAILARRIGLEINAGHDLNLNNLKDLIDHFPWIKEVSIGHALIADALYLGIDKTIQLYKQCLNNKE